MRIGSFGLDLDLWLKAWVALQRVIAAMLVLLAHAAFERILALLYTQEFQGVQKLFSVTVEVTLLSLHAWLLLEALRIFLPPPFGISLELDRPDRPINDESHTNV